MHLPNYLVNKTLFFNILLFLFFTSFSSNATTVLFNDGFEAGNLNNFACSGNCPSVATSPTKTGRYAGKFLLTPYMPKNYRTEAVFRGKGDFQRGKEYWYSMDYRYEDWVYDTSAEIAPFQVHVNPSSYAPGCNLKAAITTAPFLMHTLKNEAFFKTYNGNILWRGPIERKKWLNITVHFKLSAGNDGFIEAWKDGVKLGRVNGPTGPRLDNCGKPMRKDYLKVGVYKWDWRYKKTGSSRRQLMVDNIKIIEGSGGSSLIANKTVSKVQQPSTPIANTSTSNSKKLIAHWAMNKVSGSSVPDASGSGSTGILTNGAKLVSGKGISFDGVNDYINLGKLPLPSNAISISGWFLSSKLANCLARDCRIISKAKSVSAQDHDFMISTIKSGSSTRLRFRLKTNGKTSTLIADFGNLYDNEWVHFAAVYDGNTMRLYKDGVEVGRQSKTGSITNSSYYVWIGGNPPHKSYRPWKGFIKDIRVYNYPLTTKEIIELADI